MDYIYHKDNPLLKQHVIYMNRWDFLKLAAQRPSSHLNRCAVISFNDTLAEAEESVQAVYGSAGMNAISLTLVVKDDESMTHEEASELFDFITQNRDENFVVHCFAGASRSVAVAKWIAEFFQMDDPALAEIAHYNHHIYNLLKEIEQNEV